MMEMRPLTDALFSATRVFGAVSTVAVPSAAAFCRPNSPMPDDHSVRRKVLLRMLGHPVVLAPFLTGATVSAGVLATGGQLTVAAFSLLAGSLVSVGSFVTRLIADDGRTARKVIAELEQAERGNVQAAIDDLDRRLVSSDDDPRPENALRDLRALMSAFEEFARHETSLTSVTVVEIRAKAEQIFQQSIRSLEQTLKLGETAQRLLTPSARAPILAERERLVADIEAGTRQLGVTLAALQRLASGGHSQSELARLRDELDQSLDLASTVDARLHALMHESGLENRVRGVGSESGSVEPPHLEKKG